MASGKRVPTRSPRWSEPKESAASPQSQGPVEQPMSPQTARSPKSEVPPCGYLAAMRLRVPGQRRLTESPARAQPTSERAGQGARVVRR